MLFIIIPRSISHILRYHRIFFRISHYCVSHSKSCGFNHTTSTSSFIIKMNIRFFNNTSSSTS
nr:MAG TPA: hypothetical protein [Bacteriophage sp.]